MNSRNDVMNACEVKAGALAARAESMGGNVYVIDSQVGMNRIHTRVSTDGSSSSFHRERYTRALSIAVGAGGGNPRAGWRTGARGSRKKMFARKSRGRR